MNKQLIIGLGTGRCGTVSFCDLLKLQNIDATHEHKLLPWEFNKDCIDVLLSSIINRNKDIVSDIAFYYLPYVPYILSKYPNTKFVCLKRDKKQTVNSYMVKTYNRNHWSLSHNNRIDHIWGITYPKYDQPNKRLAIIQYWTEYYNTAEHYSKMYEDNFKIFNMVDVLNNEQYQSDMFTFIGINEFKMFLNIKKNAS